MIMKNFEHQNRRQFLHTVMAGSATLAATSLTSRLLAADDSFRGMKVGIASYSFRKFNLDQVISMTKELGVKHLTLKDMHLSLKSTPEELKAASQKIKDAGLVLMGCGVIYIKKAEDIKGIFEYAKGAGMPTIVCSPEPELMGEVEKAVKQYDIRVAVHNHGPTDKKYPSPLDVLKLINNMDPRMGVCMDVGHSVRIGENAVEVIKKCGTRMLDFHIKDVNEPTGKGKPTVLGKGIIDIPAVLKALKDINFTAHVALEFEIEPDAPMPGMKASFDCIRQGLAKIG